VKIFVPSQHHLAFATVKTKIRAGRNILTIERAMVTIKSSKFAYTMVRQKAGSVIKTPAVL
jgi:hypothetical protein